jgi:hypothetical protein
MRLLLRLTCVAAVVAIAATHATARDLTPLEAVGRIPEGYDPFRKPIPDRLPDDYVDGKPYWLPKRVEASASPELTRGLLSSTAAQSNAAERPPEGYDPFRKPIPDRLPDDFADGRPIWLPNPELKRTPTGFLGYSMWEAELGARYFFSSGRTQKDVYVFTVGDLLLSRLTYSGLKSSTGELFGRIEHATGFFLKGFAGVGGLGTGNLRDEDFLPVTDPYSSTNSAQRDGRLAYTTVDFGWAWRSQQWKTGFFAGYHYYHEFLNAFGCVQTATSPICVPSIPSTTLAISNETNVHAIRLGAYGEWKPLPALTVAAEIAFLPYSWVEATDTHWLRPFVAGEKSLSVSTVQIEASLRYQIFEGLSVGGGARYWRFDNTFSTSVRNDIPDPQAISLHTERWGVFAQASYKLGNLQPSGRPSGSF